MKNYFSYMTITVLLLLICVVVNGCSKRKLDAGANGDSEISTAKITPPHQDYRWEESVGSELRLASELDKYSDVVLTDYDPKIRKFKLVRVIQGKSWFTEEESSKVPFDYWIEVTDYTNRQILFRKLSNPSLTQGKFMGKATQQEVKRLEVLGKEPYSSSEERAEAFFNSWNDIVFVRCDQISGSVQDYYTYKGNHFKSTDDISRHKDLIIQDAYKMSCMRYHTCILYGNFDDETSKPNVVWIQFNYLVFPDKKSISYDNLRSVALKFGNK